MKRTPLVRKKPLDRGSSRLSRSSSLAQKTPIKKENPERRKRRTSKYSKTLRSARWRGIRTAVLLRAECRCERCGYEPEHWTVRNLIKCPELHIHHADGYKEFGEEVDLTKLECLCRTCHMAEHGRSFIRPRGLRKVG